MLWLATPRTASTATRDALLEAGGTRIVPHHISLKDIAQHNGEPVVTTIRNPYDALVSWWLADTSNHNRRRPFHEFIASFEHKKGNFERSGLLLYHAPTADIIVRYENLEPELVGAFERCGLGKIPLERKHVTPNKKTWRSYYYPAAIEAANRRFGAEVERYGYELLG